MLVYAYISFLVFCYSTFSSPVMFGDTSDSSNAEALVSVYQVTIVVVL